MGVLQEKLGGVVRPAPRNPYPIYDQNLRFPCLIYDLTKYLYMIAPAGTVALNIIYEGISLMVLLIMMKK